MRAAAAWRGGPSSFPLRSASELDAGRATVAARARRHRRVRRRRASALPSRAGHGRRSRRGRSLLRRRRREGRRGGRGRGIVVTRCAGMDRPRRCARGGRRRRDREPHAGAGARAGDPDRTRGWRSCLLGEADRRVGGGGERAHRPGEVVRPPAALRTGHGADPAVPLAVRDRRLRALRPVDARGRPLRRSGSCGVAGVHRRPEPLLPRGRRSRLRPRRVSAP